MPRASTDDTRKAWTRAGRRARRVDLDLKARVRALSVDELRHAAAAIWPPGMEGFLRAATVVTIDTADLDAKDQRRVPLLGGIRTISLKNHPPGMPWPESAPRGRGPDRDPLRALQMFALPVLYEIADLIATKTLPARIREARANGLPLPSRVSLRTALLFEWGLWRRGPDGERVRTADRVQPPSREMVRLWRNGAGIDREHAYRSIISHTMKTP